MAAEFVHRVNLKDFDSGIELWLERVDDSLVIAMGQGMGMHEPYMITMPARDAVVLAAHIRRLSGVMPSPPYPEDPYPDF